MAIHVYASESSTFALLENVGVYYKSLEDIIV